MSFEDLLKDLQGQNTIEEDPNHVSFDELFNEGFMKSHSKFTSFGEFLEQGNFHIKSQEDINKLDDELFDRHIARETSFKDWKSMLDTATKEYESKK
ncbi:hypothetical protein ACFO9Q_15310 [Paenibacillus sp. GCM10023252]|uniref:hypothetical protein n=1 Tax=Paenibacillus sp. GCM10023252 TaxID=3252649 RepID=UPI003614F137